MFKSFRKLLSHFGASNASVPESSNNTSTKVLPSESSGSTSRIQGCNYKSGPAYCAAFNYAAPPKRYASGVFKMTPSPPPNAALSGYMFSQLKSSGAPASRINNIPPPPFPMFGAPTSNSATESDDIDMPDADTLLPPTPPTTPPRDDDTQSSSKGSSQKDDQNATVEDDNTTESNDNAAPPPPADRDDRPRLLPRRQQERQRTTATTQTPTNWVDEIEIEEDIPDNKLPIGYLGTFRGTRHFIPEYPGMKLCSSQTKHLLICGHWIDSAKPCGSNCKKQDHSQEQFNCPTCRDIVSKILTGPFPAPEATRLKGLRKEKKKIALIACCVEQVVRAAPQLKTGVTEAVTGFVINDYGRTCEPADNPDPKGWDTIERVVRDMQQRSERKKRERFARENPLNTHEKCVRDEDGVDSQADTGHSADNDAAAKHEDTQGNTSPPNNKKQKTILETHREPITPSARGTKRRSSSPPSNDDDDANVSPFSSLPTASTLSQPPKKRLFVKPDPTFGEASFILPPAHVVGPLMRKRHADVYVEGEIERESKGRRSSAEEEKMEKAKGFEAFKRAWDGEGEGEDDDGECEL